MFVMGLDDRRDEVSILLVECQNRLPLGSALQFKRKAVDRVCRSHSQVASHTESQTDQIHAGGKHPGVLSVRRNAHYSSTAAQRGNHTQVSKTIKRQPLWPSQSPIEPAAVPMCIAPPHGIKARDGRSSYVQIVIRTKSQVVGRD